MNSEEICHWNVIFLVTKTLKDIINHSLTWPLEALYWGVWGGMLSNADHNYWPTTKNFKITPVKTPLNSPQKTKLGPKNKWFKTSYLEFIFYFRFSSRKSQRQQNAAWKITTHFTIEFRSKKLTHLTNFDTFIIVKSILPQHS